MGRQSLPPPLNHWCTNVISLRSTTAYCRAWWTKRRQVRATTIEYSSPLCYCNSSLATKKIRISLGS